MTSHIYSYNADCRQPDPEIWGGGVVGGPLVFSSNSQESFLRIYNKEITTPNSATGVISFYGSFIFKPSWTGIATHLITGYITEKRSYSHLGTLGINVSGSAVEKFISRDETVVDSLIVDIFSTEKVTYDYNLDSSVSFETENDGLISEVITEIIDYGNVLDVVSEGQEDYGSTEILSITSASIGTISLNGSGIYNVLSDEINTVLLTFSNALIESVSWNPPENLKLYENDISSSELTFDSISLTFDANEPKPDIKITGSASNIFVSYDPPEGETNLTSSGQLIEKTTHHYNESSITIFEPETYGSITDVVSETFDYGFVSSSAEGNEDLGLIVFAETNNPFGTASFSGSAFVKAPDDIRTYGGVGAVYKVSYNPPENTASLFSFGQKSESVSYNYSITSIEYVELESYDLITSPTSVTDDYGAVDGVLTDFIDYEGIDITSTTFSFGTLNLSGSASVEYKDINFYGYVTGAEVKVVYSPDNTEGTLFGFGEKLESVTYDYNLDSIREFVTEDLESISSGVTLTDDYGLVTEIQTTFFDYGLTDDAPVGTTPFGLFNVSGSAESQYTNINFYGYVTGAEVKVAYSPDDTSGTLFGFGEKLESVTYDYNEDSILSVGIPNYGSIGDAPSVLEDYGFISELHSQTEDSGSILGFSAGEDVIPFGSLTIVGSSDEKHVENYYVNNIVPLRTFEFTTDNTRLTGINTTSLVGVAISETGVGTNNINGFNIPRHIKFGTVGGVGQRRVDLLPLNLVDYQSITFSAIKGNSFNGGEEPDFGEDLILQYSINGGTTFTNIELIVEENDVTFNSLNDVTITIPTVARTPSTILRILQQNNSGSVFDNYGISEIVLTPIDSTERKIIISSGYSDLQFISQTPGDISIFTCGGSAVEKNADSYIGSGSLFELGYITERTTYSYNLDSDVTYNSDSFGSIFDSVTEILDYGQLTSPISQGNEDFGSVILSDTTDSFGSILLFGESNNQYQAQIPEETINVNVTGIKEERVTYIPPINQKGDGTLSSEELSYDSTLNNFDATEQPDIKLTGSSTYSPVIYSEVGSGSLFNIGTSDKSVTYDYNESSILGYTIEDSGSVTDSVTSEVDYGSVGEVYLGEIDGGSISDTLILSPFGSINIGGSASAEWINVNIYGPPEAIVRIAYSPDDTSGTLFGFGEKLESVTYDYNEASVLIVEEINNGTIVDPASIIEDYGFIDQVYVGEEDSGSVDIVTSFAFGFLSITGNAGVEFGNANFFGPPEAIVRIAYSPDDTSGTLFGFGEKLESVTYDYNLDSILSVGIPNYGSIGDAPSVLEDYGFVFEIHSSSEDYQLLIDPASPVDVYPFGSLTILGSASIESLFEESFTGIVTVLGSVYTTYTQSYTSETATVSISGTSTVKFTSSEVATDELVISGTKNERRTKSYNESSILPLSEQLLDYGTLFTTTELSSDYGSVAETATENSEEFGLVPTEITSTIYPFGTIIISGRPLVHPEVDYTPKYTGTGLISISGSALESETDDFGSDRRRGGNIRYCGDAETREIANYGYYGDDNDPGTSGSIFINGTLIERETDSYAGLGIVVISDNALENDAEVYVGLGTAAFSGVALESFSAQTPEDTQLFTFYGELNHPQIDYTPHYGIEKNIGVGTTGIQISGVVDDSAQRIARGTGTISVVNGFSPEDTQAYPGGPSVGRSWSYTRSTYIAEPVSINISNGVDQTRYYSPIYPRNALITDPSSGIGTIRINDDKGLTFARAVLPVYAKGTIYILGIGTAGNGDLNGVEFGAKESFTPSTEIGTGLFTISGVSSNREIAVYTEVGSGNITLSESSIIRDSQSHQSSGIIYLGRYEVITQSLGDDSLTFDNDTVDFDDVSSQFVYSEAIVTETDAYGGTGRINVLGGTSESFILQSKSNTQLFKISGSGSDAYSAQTPETEVLYQVSGNITESRTYGYEGFGQASFTSSAKLIFEPKVLGTGLLRFATYLSDNLYDTCDSLDLTSDLQDSAYVRFSSNPPENTALFAIDGNADASETSLYTEIVTGLYTLSGTYQNIKLTHSDVGIGTIFVTETSSDSERDVYIGSGSLFAISGATEFYSARTPTSIVALEISGSAISSTESDYSVVGIGLFTFNGTSTVIKTTSYTEIASGSISLSGQLLYPDIIFIPSPVGSGTIDIIGYSDSSLTKVYNDTTGYLFQFSSGIEAFAKSTYIGLGTVYIEQISASTTNNPYQIPRTYVCII